VRGPVECCEFDWLAAACWGVAMGLGDPFLIRSVAFMGGLFQEGWAVIN